MTDEVAKDFGNKLKEIDDDLFLEFAHSDDKDKWLNDNAERLEGYDLFTKKYDNFYDFIVPKDDFNETSHQLINENTDIIMVKGNYQEIVDFLEESIKG